MRPRRSNYHDVAYLQAKTVPMNLIWSESARWLLSSGIRWIPEALITTMGMPIMPPWTNDNDIAHLQAKAVQINSIWSEPAQWLLISSIRKILGALVMPTGIPAMPPMGKWLWHCASTGQDSSKELDLEWIGPVVAELRHLQDSKSPYHSHGHYYAPMNKWPGNDIEHLQANALQINLIWSEPAQWLLISGIRKILWAFIMAMGTLVMPSMGIWS